LVRRVPEIFGGVTFPTCLPCVRYYDSGGDYGAGVIIDLKPTLLERLQHLVTQLEPFQPKILQLYITAQRPEVLAAFAAWLRSRSPDTALLLEVREGHLDQSALDDHLWCSPQEFIDRMTPYITKKAIDGIVFHSQLKVDGFDSLRFYDYVQPLREFFPQLTYVATGIKTSYGAASPSYLAERMPGLSYSLVYGLPHDKGPRRYTLGEEGCRDFCALIFEKLRFLGLQWS
jgi:hypothetical protein